MIAVATLLGPSRTRATVEARREAARILRDRGLSLPHIGRILKRDHATVMNLLSPRCRKVRPVKAEEVPHLVYWPNKPDLSGEWAI
jgi:chromosomal replication initiation ATPase DnaA